MSSVASPRTKDVTAALPLAETPSIGPARIKDHRPRLHYGDPMRLLACIAVVGVHVSLLISEDIPRVGSAVWWYAALLDGASRWAVTVFVMLSGALLLV